MILLIPTIIAQFPFMHSSEGTIGIMTLVVMTIQLVVLLVPIYYVEKKLKHHFDENGKRKI